MTDKECKDKAYEELADNMAKRYCAIAEKINKTIAEGSTKTDYSLVDIEQGFLSLAKQIIRYYLDKEQFAIENYKNTAYTIFMLTECVKRVCEYSKVEDTTINVLKVMSSETKMKVELSTDDSMDLTEAYATFMTDELNKALLDIFKDTDINMQLIASTVELRLYMEEEENERRNNI